MFDVRVCCTVVCNIFVVRGKTNASIMFGSVMSSQFHSLGRLVLVYLFCLSTIASFGPGHRLLPVRVLCKLNTRREKEETTVVEDICKYRVDGGGGGHKRVANAMLPFDRCLPSIRGRM